MTGDLPTIAASGLGPLPGRDPRDAAGWVLDVLADDVPHLPQLPDRGPWAGDVARSAALLVDLPVEVAVDRWQVAARPGRDLRRAGATLAEDLDAFEEHWAERTSPAKVQVLGPWSLAAAVERRSGEALAADPGAVTDVAASLAEGVAGHVADLRRRLVGLTGLVVTLDEPALPALLSGSVPTRSGLSRLAPLDPGAAARPLGVVVDAVRAAGAQVVVATSHDDAAVTVARQAGADGWCGDLGAPDVPLDSLGAWVDQGARVVAACDVLAGRDPATAASLRARWRRWGLRLGAAPVLVVARAPVDLTRDVARDAYREAVTTARRLRDEEG